MRLTKDNIDKYLNKYGNLDLHGNEDITHIDYLPNNIKLLYMSVSNIEEITCELPEGLNFFHCNNSQLKSLPLLPKSLYSFDGEYTNLPDEFRVYIGNDKIKCNNLRKLQMINSL